MLNSFHHHNFSINPTGIIPFLKKRVWWISSLVSLLLLPLSSAFAAGVTLAWDPNSESTLAGYKLYYGTSSGQYSAVTNLGNTNTYTVSLPAGTYYFAVTAYSADGLESGYSNEVSTSITVADAAPPILSNITVGVLGSSSASIAWQTNEIANTQLEYGLTASYGSLSSLDSTLALNHSMTLTGLLPQTTYHYRVKSSDAAGNLALSADFSFTTSAPPDTTLPVLSAITASSLTASGVIITWQTNEIANTQLEYGLTASYGSLSSLDSTLALAHSVALTGLLPQTTYHYRVKSSDAAGNLALSADFSFTTPAPPDTTPPVLSAIAASGITASGAVITWQTNEASDSTVEYGLTSAYGSATVKDSTLVNSHSRTLSGLNSSTLYHFRVRSADAVGNAGYSADYTFTTSAPAESATLVAAYAFDEGSGTKVADSSGYGNTGTLYSGKWTTIAKMGRALYFDGSRDYVTFGTNGLPNIGKATSISCWINVPYRSYQTRTAVALSNSAGTAALYLGYKNSQVGVMTSADAWIVAATAPSFQQWHHLAYTFDGTQHRLYIDGSLKATSTVSPGSGTVGIFRIGARVSRNYDLQGYLDELKIYSGALSAEKISSLASGTAAAKASSQALATAMAEDSMQPAGEEPASMASPVNLNELPLSLRKYLEERASNVGERIGRDRPARSLPSAETGQVELKTWLSQREFPMTAVSMAASRMDISRDNGLDPDSMPQSSNEPLPSGVYQLKGRLLHPVTGDLIFEESQDLFVDGWDQSYSENGYENSSAASWTLDAVPVLEETAEGLVRLVNLNPARMAIEIKAWLEIPGQDSIPLLTIGEEGSLILEPGVEFSTDPLAFYQIPQNILPGVYEIKLRVLDAVTGKIFETISRPAEIR